MSGPKCLRCGAGAEWIKGKVPNEPKPSESDSATGSNEWLAGVELLARRAYPGLKHSGLCSRHSEGGHFECGICYPDLNGLLAAHMEASNKLYGQILDLSGLSDPPNGRVGTNAIVAALRRKLKGS